MCLKHIDLTMVLAHNDYDILQAFVDSLEFMANDKASQILTLNLPNNSLKDESVEQLINKQVLQKFKNLERLDLSGNQLTDYGLQALLAGFVKEHAKLESLKLSYNKFRKLDSAEILSEAISKCPNLKELVLKKCNLTTPHFKKLCDVLSPKLLTLDLASNKLSNEALEYFHQHLMTNFGQKYQLESLNFYNCDLEGKKACNLVMLIVPILKKLKVMNIEGNLIYPIDLVQLKERVDCDIEQQKLKI